MSAKRTILLVSVVIAVSLSLACGGGSSSTPSASTSLSPSPSVTVSPSPSPSPTPTPTPTPRYCPKSAVVSENSGFVILADGQVYAFGDNDYGQLGLGDTNDRSTLTMISGLDSVKQIVIGRNFSLALREDGTVYGWGQNSYGQLAMSTPNSSNSPIHIEAFDSLNVMALYCAYDAAFALTTDGKLYSWGDSNLGVTGTGTGGSTPTQVTGCGGVPIRAVATGRFHVIALTIDGRAYSWGYNNDGELGRSTYPSERAYYPGRMTELEALGSIISIEAGCGHTLALMNDGRVYYWGRNTYLPTLVTGLDDKTAVRIDTGGWNSQIFCSDGSVYVFGDNGYGKLMLGNEDGVSTPTLAPDFATYDLLDYTSGWSFSLTMSGDGNVYGAGQISNSYNNSGPAVSNPQLMGVLDTGSVTSDAITATVQLDGSVEIAWSDVPTADSVVIRKYLVGCPGEIQSWTANPSDGTFGDASFFPEGVYFEYSISAVYYWGESVQRFSAPVIPEPVRANKAITLASGTGHTLALFQDGPYVWGNNASSQLGTGNTNNQPYPLQVTSWFDDSGITPTQLICGAWFSLLIDSDNHLWSFGRNNDGQLGLGDKVECNVPTIIPSLASISIAKAQAGYDHVAALNQNGKVYTWGINNRGQLGLGDNTERLTPVLMPFFSSMTVTDVSSGDYYSIAVSGNRVYSWGYNSSGQLGLGDNVDYDTPQTIVALDYINVTAVICGMSHVLALCSDGKVFSWGSNSIGQLGLGDAVNRDVPVEIEFFADKKVIQLAAGGNLSYALCADGSVYSWGNDYYGQLGLGTSGGSVNVPTLVTGLSGKGVVKIVSGLNSGFFICANGDIFACGDNNYSQIRPHGDYTSPTLITPLATQP